MTIAASSYKDENGYYSGADLEVIVGSQYSSQNITGCDPDQFDFQKNNGTVIFRHNPRSAYPQDYAMYFNSGTANASKVKIRCVNTSPANVPEGPSFPVNAKKSFLLIYSVTIAEGNPPSTINNCERNDVTISRDIMVNYATQPTWTYPTIEGSFNSTTVTSRIDIKNGTYRILSNHNIYLKPPFHAGQRKRLTQRSRQCKARSAHSRLKHKSD